MNILIVEDQVALSDALCRTLQNENYRTTAVYDGVNGYYEALTGTYDVMILDVMLPQMDGFEVLRRLRSEKMTLPILMLTAKSDLESRVTGLDTGADYYLTKPFEIPELLACVRAIARRRKDTLEENEPQYGDLCLKVPQGGVLCSQTGQFIKMGAKELGLLEMLMLGKGKIIPKERFMERIWGFESDAEYNTVEVYVSFLRKKLKFIGSRTVIKAARGLGYSLDQEGKQE